MTFISGKIQNLVCLLKDIGDTLCDLQYDMDHCTDELVPDTVDAMGKLCDGYAELMQCLNSSQDLYIKSHNS